MDTQIEKILAVINDEPYPFSIEVFKGEEDGESTIYRATPAQEDEKIAKLVPGYIEFDDKGNVQPEDITETETGKAIADGVWRGIKEQVINSHASFNQPL